MIAGDLVAESVLPGFLWFTLFVGVHLSNRSSHSGVR